MGEKKIFFFLLIFYNNFIYLNTHDTNLETKAESLFY